jgi:hypothetical protein
MNPCFNNLLSETERNLTKNIAKKRSSMERVEDNFQTGAVPSTGTSTLVWQVFKEVSKNYLKNFKISNFHRSTSSTKVAIYCGGGKTSKKYNFPAKAVLKYQSVSSSYVASERLFAAAENVVN